MIEKNKVVRWSSIKDCLQTIMYLYLDSKYLAIRDVVGSWRVNHGLLSEIS